MGTCCAEKLVVPNLSDLPPTAETAETGRGKLWSRLRFSMASMLLEWGCRKGALQRTKSPEEAIRAAEEARIARRNLKT